MPLLGQQLITLMALGVALSVIVAWVAASYFYVDVVGSLIWPGYDGYCEPTSQGLGHHCFSDLAMYLGLGASMDPQGLTGSVKYYPPLNRFGFFVFQVVGLYFGQIPTVLLYVGLSAVCLLLPVVWASRGMALRDRTLAVSVVGLLTYPFLATVDRGNNIAFAVPLMWLFILALRRNMNGPAVLAIIIGSQIKPQIGILAVALLVVRRYREFLIAVVGSVGLFVLSFSIFWVAPGGLSPIQEFKDFLLFTRFFDQYVPLTQMYPLNISFVHLFGLAYEALGLGVASTDVLQWIVYFIVGVSILAIVWRGRELGEAIWFPALLMGILLTPNPVFAYYLVGALIVGSFYFHGTLAQQITVSGRGVRVLLTTAVVASLLPLLIPAGWAEAPAPTVGNGVVISLLPRVASVLWLVYLVIIAVSAVRRARKPFVVAN